MFQETSRLEGRKCAESGIKRGAPGLDWEEQVAGELTGWEETCGSQT